jgi:cytidylate kinase
VPVALIGMPGSGKSAIGKATAKRLALSYADCDQALERRAGCSIAAFFAASGEQAFRDLESEMLATLLEAADSVVATGQPRAAADPQPLRLPARLVGAPLEAAAQRPPPAAAAGRRP